MTRRIRKQKMKTAIVKFFQPLSDLTTITVIGYGAIILQLVEKYVFSDWEYLRYLAVLVFLDSCLGFYRAWKEKTIESKGFGRVIEKILLYMATLSVIHVMAQFTVENTAVGILTFLRKAAYSYILIREGISIVEHVSILRPGFFPTKILDRLKKYKESGKINDLISDEEK